MNEGIRDARSCTSAVIATTPTACRTRSGDTATEVETFTPTSHFA
jgi:hypothetical protein